MKPYVVKKLQNQSYAAIVIGVSYESPITYIDEIENDLKEKSFSGMIIFDLLLYSGNTKDRFFEMYFDGEKFDESTSTHTIIKRLTPLRKIACNILTKNYQYVEDSILNNQQKNLIKKGLCI